VVDHRGRRYLDFLMGWGALIFGHNPGRVTAALRQAMAEGLLPGLTTPAEAALARLITEAVPSVEQVRFTVSGTEACMTALRLARGVTGRPKLVVFDGCYHGHSDSLLAGKTAGIPAATVRDTLIAPYNDLAAVERAFAQHGREIACVIVEPVAANMGVVLPRPGFLVGLRELTRRHGGLLIFDEVVTGFRLGWGGAQDRCGIRPDLTVFGKIVGGGLPIGAVGGPRSFLSHLAPQGEVYHGGTFAGHPLSMACGLATLNALKTGPPYERLERLTERVASGLLAAAERARVSIQVNRVGSMFTVFFSERPVEALVQATGSDRARFARWARGLLERGVLIPPSPVEALFLSTAHTAAHAERFLREAAAAFAEIR
jgi:glutamate-1-semialdehyde 2,1-aminomutase